MTTRDQQNLRYWAADKAYAAIGQTPPQSDCSPPVVAARAEAAMIRLDVIGTPQPQGNKSAFHNAKTGKTVLVEGRRPASRAAFKSWREGIAAEAKAYQAEHRIALIDEPVAIVVTFRMPRPRSTPKKVTHPAVRPDLDKLQRAVLDALEGTLLMNDSRVVDLHARKVFAVDEPPGCEITIVTLADALAATA